MRSERISATAVEVEPSSFRDPSGFVFERDGTLYRQVNASYGEHFERLIDSGLYDHLVGAGLLVPHEEVPLDRRSPDCGYKLLKPERVPFISYPYEWTFSQLKDAALATLAVQKAALDHEMSLKDCSAYNIQFLRGRPIFIDTLSFEIYREGSPWVAYRQFCQHFLAPLALMSQVDVRLGQLLRVHLDGLPLDLASVLLPRRTWVRIGLLAHVHLHAKAQARFSKQARKPAAEATVSRLGMLGLVDNLERTIRVLNWQPEGTEWAEYYDQTNYSEDSAAQKRALVGEFIDAVHPRCVWDIGANTGLYSRVASERNIRTIAYDIDPAAVEKNYRSVVASREANLLPLLLDLNNPSPGIGWENGERKSLLERGPIDMVMALALIHHLVIGNNVPLHRVAVLFARMARHLIVEFVPKTDSQVEKLLATREDIFPDYQRSAFEREFGRHFTLDRAVELRGSERILYLMTSRAFGA